MNTRTTLASAMAAITLLAPAAAAEAPHFGVDTADEYVVEPGDTLEQIAQDYLGSKDLWRHIAEANGIDDPRELRAGQKLQIPKRKAAWFEGSTP